MKEKLFDFLKDGQSTVSDNKLIVFLTFIVASVVLMYSAYTGNEHLDTLFITYCIAFPSLKVTKGYVDTMQKKKGDPDA